MSGRSSYSGAPRSDDKVALVRLALGDTGPSVWMFTDQEIQIYLDAAGSVVTYAAASLALAAAAKASADVDFKSGRTSFSLSQKFDHYMRLHKELKRGGAGDIAGGDGTGVPNSEMLVGGISISEKEALQTDTDRIHGAFRLGRDDHPDTDDTVDDDDIQRRRYGG